VGDRYSYAEGPDPHPPPPPVAKASMLANSTSGIKDIRLKALFGIENGPNS